MQPAPGEVLLSVKAVGINFRDVLNVLGMYPGDPGAPGSDAVGVVMAAGVKPDSLTHIWSDC
jgi:NADPH:quinone reductase-like Zn-dependent oxidoreductase